MMHSSRDRESSSSSPEKQGLKNKTITRAEIKNVFILTLSLLKKNRDMDRKLPHSSSLIPINASTK